MTAAEPIRWLMAYAMTWLMAVVATDRKRVG